MVSVYLVRVNRKCVTHIMTSLILKGFPHTVHSQIDLVFIFRASSVAS